MKTMFLFPALLALGATPAAANENVKAESQSKTTVEKDADGHYSRKQTSSSESTDAQGTTTQSEINVKVDTDADGNAQRKVTTESSTDPKGLMNKTKSKTIDNVKYRNGKVEKTHKKVVNGKTVEETQEETSAN